MGKIDLKEILNNKKLIKRVLIFSSVSLLVLIFVFYLIYYGITQTTKSNIYMVESNLPTTQAALILGAKVNNDNSLSDMLKDRADVAIELLNAGKVSKILVSGDHGTKNYDEVNAIKRYLLEKGVDQKIIFLDHAGFNTYDSLYRAKAVFQVDSLTITTQDFHLPRSVYIGNSLGIKTYGVKADRRNYGRIEYNYLREVPADIKDFFEVSFHVKSKFLGEKIPITGDSKKSWD